MCIRDRYAHDPLGLGDPNYDVSLDGQRFLMLTDPRPSEGSTSPQLILTLNWFEELTRLVPVD